MGMKKDEWHFLVEKNPETKRGICSLCGEVELRLYKRPNGRQDMMCVNKAKEAWLRTARQVRNRRWAKKGNSCSKCGFVGHPCQIETHHKDGDHFNNDPTNLEKLCTNCHRMETWKNKHWENRYGTQKG